MTHANIERLIGVAAPLWAGEAEVVRTYRSSRIRNLETDLLWLQRDEFEHMLGGIAGIAQEGLAEADWRLMEKLIAEQLRHRIRMRNAQFSRPLPEERVQA